MEEVIELFNRFGVRYLLIGGQAVIHPTERWNWGQM